MIVKKIYLKKKIKLLNYKNYLIINKVTTTAITEKNTNIIPEPLFNGGSFLKILITKNNDNLMKILINKKINIVCLFFDNKWYFGNYIKHQNLIKQNNKILSLLCKLKKKQ